MAWRRWSWQRGGLGRPPDRVSRVGCAAILFAVALVGCANPDADAPISSPTDGPSPELAANPGPELAANANPGPELAADAGIDGGPADGSELALPALGRGSESSHPRRPVRASDLVAASGAEGRPLLRDPSGRPWLAVGDTASSFVARLDEAEAVEYLDQRAELGFNLLVVNLIDASAVGAPNANGDEPFVGAGRFDRPVAAYFDHAHALVTLAEERGFVVMLAPAPVGDGGADSAWLQEMVVAGPQALHDYGRYVGERFADLDNIVWLAGGDRSVASPELALVEAVRDGLVAGGAVQPHTAAWGRGSTSSDLSADWLDLELVVPDADGSPALSGAPFTPADLPHLVIESTPESGGPEAVAARRRSQIYESILAGASGSVIAEPAIRQFAPDWRTSLDTFDARAMALAARFFRTVGWARDPADPGAPAGEPLSVISDVTWAGDGSSVVAYADGVDVDLIWIPADGAEPSALWFDPTDGSSRSPEGRSNEGVTRYVHPGLNSAGDRDWVLVVWIG